MSRYYGNYNQYLGAQRCCDLRGQGPQGPQGPTGPAAIGPIGNTGPAGMGVTGPTGRSCRGPEGPTGPTGSKTFIIDHPTDANKHLVHVCLEGPEAGVYIRGKGKGKIIEIPDYWKGLIDENSISVHLTPYGNSHVLFVEKIKNSKIYIESNWEVSGTDIEYYYIINASRIDGEKLIIEYKGNTPADYPGSPDQFSISGYDYGRN